MRYFCGSHQIFSEEYFCGSHQYFRGSRKNLGFSAFFSEKFWVRHSLRIDVTKKVGSQESFDFVQIGSYGFQSVWAYIRDSTNILSITGSQELICFAFWEKMLFLPVNASWILFRNLLKNCGSYIICVQSCYAYILKPRLDVRGIKSISPVLGSSFPTSLSTCRYTLDYGPWYVAGGFSPK